MTGKVTLIFPGSQGFPGAVGTLKQVPLIPTYYNLLSVIVYYLLQQKEPTYTSIKFSRPPHILLLLD